jgi:hypothetical protein
MTPEQISLLHRASQSPFISPEARKSLKLENPFLHDSRTGRALQKAVAELNPLQARLWAKEAGASLSLAAAAAQQGLAPMTPEIEEELSRLAPQTGDERVAQLVQQATANGNPFDKSGPGYSVTNAMRLEIEAPDVAARLKAQAQPAAPAHNFTDGEVAVLQRHGYSLPTAED